MNDRTCADRVRPFLQAMERSIDAARRRRLSGGNEPEPMPVQPAGASPVVTDPDSAPRLRARPKRPTYPVGSQDDARYRTQVG